jgi:hypothetical protein
MRVREGEEFYFCQFHFFHNLTRLTSQQRER